MSISETVVVPEANSLKEKRLIGLAREHNILRLSAEEGLSEDEAISVIEQYSELIGSSSLPSEYYSQLA